MIKKALISFTCVMLVLGTMAQEKLSFPGACADAGYNTPYKGSHVRGDGNHALGQSYNNSACGLNYVESSLMITTRYTNTLNPPLGAGPGFPCAMPAISGIPACYVVDKAFLYWDESYQSGASTAPTLTFTNPSGTTASFPSTLIGTDGAKCWGSEGEVGTYGFRADVTAAITGAGNGVYTINNIVGNGGENNAWEVDGATLIIIYKDISAAYQGSLIIDDGEYTMSSGGDFSNTVTGFTACAAGVNATAFLMVADLQDNATPTFTPTLNGTTSNTFPGLFWNFCQDNTTVTTGQTTSGTYSIDDASDCYAVIVNGLYFQTTTCAVCAPPVVLSLNTSSTQASCSVCNGTATVSGTGGSTPYSYTWSCAPVQNTATASNLCAGTYTVTVSDATGCNSATASVVVGSSAVSTVSVTPVNSTICSGNSVTLTASGVVSYAWAPAAGLSVTTGTTTVATPAATVTYIVTGTDATGCTSQSSALITVNPNPTVSVTASANPLCAVANTTLTAAGELLIHGAEDLALQIRLPLRLLPPLPIQLLVLLWAVQALQTLQLLMMQILL